MDYLLTGAEMSAWRLQPAGSCSSADIMSDSAGSREEFLPGAVLLCRKIY